MKKEIKMFMLIDALGWNYIKDRPFLADICAVKQKVRSVLGYSSGVIPSILTGEPPSVHKHWSLFYYSPEKSPFRWQNEFPSMPNRLLNSRLGRKIVEEASKKLMGYSGYFETYLIPVEYLPFFDICERTNIYQPGGIRNAKSIFDIWREQGKNYLCLSYPMKDTEIWEAAFRELEDAKADCCFIYLAELDAFLHGHCKENKIVDERINWYEKEITKLYRIAEKSFSSVALYVFSDHGMSPVNQSYSLKNDIDLLKVTMPDDYAAMYDSTMARFWFFNNRAKEQITNLLGTKFYGRILSDEESRNYGIHFEDNMYGEVIFLMKTGSVINPSFMGKTIPEGMHGFDINDDTMDAVFLSNVNRNYQFEDVRGFFNVMEES